MGVGDSKQNVLTKRSKTAQANRRLHLCILFVCTALLFILLALWRLQQQPDGIYTAVNNLWSVVNQQNSGGSRPTTAPSNPTSNAAVVTYENIDPQVWRQAAEMLSALSVAHNEQTINTLEGLYVRPTDQPAPGDIAGTFNNGLSIVENSVALGSDTVGDYIAALATGDGLSGGASGEGTSVTLSVTAGDGITVNNGGVNVALAPQGGLVLEGGEVSLLTSCSNGQMLKWASGLTAWVCGNDNSGAGSLTVRESDGSPAITPASLLEFGPATNASDEFVISDQGGGTVRIRTGTAVPLSNTAQTISGAWTYTNPILATGGLTIHGNTYTDLAGNGLSFNGGILSTTLGTAIDTTEITDGTILAADIANNTLTFNKLGQNGCTSNQIIQWNGSGWACAVDSDSQAISNISNTLSITGNASTVDLSPYLDNTDVLASLSCSSGQLAKWNGSAWACAADVDTDTNTTYSAGTGLSLGGTTFSLDSSLAMFKTIDASLGTDPVADGLTDTLSLTSGNGVNVTGDATADSVAFSLNLAPSGGLTLIGGALTLLNTCGSGQYLAWSSTGSSWDCTSTAATPNIFQTVAGDSGSAAADSPTDTLSLIGGNGLTTTGASSPDSVTFDIDLASGSGLAFAGSALTLQSCSDGQILKRVSGAWACAADNGTALANAYKQQLAGTDNITVGSSLTPLLTNGSGTAQSLGITITSGNEVSLNATTELSSTLATGPVTYAIIRDDNHDNDCATGGGDGTQIGGQVTSFIASTAQSFTNSFTFADNAPPSTTVYYQLCASTTIGVGTAAVADRSLLLNEVNL